MEKDDHLGSDELAGVHSIELYTAWQIAFHWIWQYPASFSPSSIGVPIGRQ
jgi:hypothetical protein